MKVYSKENPPASLDEMNERFHQNYKLEGFGIGNVYINMPCPACAAAGFSRYELLQMEAELSKPHTCGECGFSCKAVFKRTRDSMAFEFVQLAGTDLPAWYPIKMRRAEEAEKDKS